MPDSDSREHSAIATAEPPKPPANPPATGTASPEPDPARWRLSWGCLIALSVFLVLVLVPGLGTLAWWRLKTHPTAPPQAPRQVGAFASAMAKAGVRAPAEPTATVELTRVRATGTHSFDATFTCPELTTLMAAFSHAVTVRGAPVTVSNAILTSDGGDKIALEGEVSAAGASYSGRVSGPVAWQSGHIVAPSGLDVTAAGIPIPGSQGQQVVKVLLAYVNGYVGAAPGLKVVSATVTGDGVHVTGTAPDSISW
jgi:hypothetical protein